MTTWISRATALFFLGFSSLALSEAPEPYPLEYWALRSVMSSVEVSPDGKKIGMLKTLGKFADPQLHIHDTDDLDGEPYIISADPMEIRSFYWVSDDALVISLRQRIRDSVKGNNKGVYAGKIALFSLKSKEFEQLGDLPNPSITSILRKDPDNIIVSTIPGTGDDLGLTEAFRPTAYYKLNLDKGTTSLIVRGKISLGQIDFDESGEPWIGRGFSRTRKEYIWYYREDGENDWTEFYSMSEDSPEAFSVLGKDEAVPGNFLVLAQNGNTFKGLWSFNPAKKEFSELLYRRNDVDVYGVRRDSNNWERPGRITAVSYYKDKFHYEYFDEIEGATYAQLEQIIPNAHYVAIQSRSRDGETFTVYNQGPRDPGTYFLYREGQFQTIGTRQPLLESKNLADLMYTVAPARDGRTVPSLVHVPQGEAPFPTVVLPHGGPEIHEIIIYDEWAQMLANNGYLVIQPQYRISEGYGMDHYFAGFEEGAYGIKTQDDMDDAALHLVEKGLADPERMAMFGWSAGGYASLVAATRTPQLYKCTIAGAPVSDPVWQANDTTRKGGITSRGWIKQVFENRYRGASPVDDIEKVNVPIMLVHGDDDQRVRFHHSKVMADLLEEHNKPYKLIVLEGADHYSNTLFYDHKLQLYTNLIDFLKNDCFGSEMQASNQ